MHCKINYAVDIQCTGTFLSDVYNLLIMYAVYKIILFINNEFLKCLTGITLTLWSIYDLIRIRNDTCTIAKMTC